MITDMSTSWDVIPVDRFQVLRIEVPNEVYCRKACVVVVTSEFIQILFSILLDGVLVLKNILLEQFPFPFVALSSRTMICKCEMRPFTIRFRVSGIPTETFPADLQLWDKIEATATINTTTMAYGAK